MSDAPDNVSTALRLLKAVALELRELAKDTVNFGDALAGDEGCGGKRSIQLLQKFDVFAQSLSAHALLIDSLSGRIEAGQTDVQELDQLLGHVPFFGVRERLRAVVTGSDVTEEASEVPVDLWFLGE